MPTTKLKNILSNGSIQVYLDGFCFCGPTESVFFSNQDAALRSKDWPATVLNDLFTAPPALLLFDAPATHVPDALFDESMLSAYYEFFDKLPKGSRLKSSKNLENVHTVYPENEKGIAPIKKHYNDIEVYHFQELLYECLREHSSTSVFRKNIYIHLQQGHFELYIFQGNSLVLSNRFPHDGAETFLYYLFFVIETLSLEQEEYDLYFLGKFDRYAPYYDGVNLFSTSSQFLFTSELKTEHQNILPAPFFSF